MKDTSIETQIDQLVAKLKTLQKEIRKKKRLSEKLSGMTLENSSDRARGGLREKLNWQCMEVDQKTIDIARFFKGSRFDVGTEKRIYRPSGFHEYEYWFRSMTGCTQWADHKNHTHSTNS